MVSKAKGKNNQVDDIGQQVEIIAYILDKWFSQFSFEGFSSLAQKSLDIKKNDIENTRIEIIEAIDEFYSSIINSEDLKNLILEYLNNDSLNTNCFEECNFLMKQGQTFFEVLLVNLIKVLNLYYEKIRQVADLKQRDEILNFFRIIIQKIVIIANSFFLVIESKVLNQLESKVVSEKNKLDLIDPNRDILQNEISTAPDCYEGPRVYSPFFFVEEYESIKQLHQEITNSLETTDLNLMNDLEELQILISDLDKESINRALENYFQKSKRGSNLLGNYSEGLPLNLGLRSIPARKFKAWVSEIFEVHKGLVEEGDSLRIQHAPLMVRAYEFLSNYSGKLKISSKYVLAS